MKTKSLFAILLLFAVILFTGCKGEEPLFTGGKGVYVVGYEHESVVAKLWKDGVQQKLLLKERNWSVANSVFVSGNDVYIVGWETEMTISAALWKNGIKQNFPDGHEANSVYVSGKDVYVAGSGNEGDGVVAVLWKNGVRQKLSNLLWSEANSVFVSGNDVYVAGREYEGDVALAVLWKNGVKQKLSDEYSVANSVFVSGNDVYVAGGERTQNKYSATL